MIHGIECFSKNPKSCIVLELISREKIINYSRFQFLRSCTRFWKIYLLIVLYIKFFSFHKKFCFLGWFWTTLGAKKNSYLADKWCCLRIWQKWTSYYEMWTKIILWIWISIYILFCTGPHISYDLLEHFHIPDNNNLNDVINLDLKPIWRFQGFWSMRMGENVQCGASWWAYHPSTKAGWFSLILSWTCSKSAPTFS